MFEFGTLCLKSENSVQNQTVVAKIDSYVQNRTHIQNRTQVTKIIAIRQTSIFLNFVYKYSLNP